MTAICSRGASSGILQRPKGSHGYGVFHPIKSSAIQFNLRHIMPPSRSALPPVYYAIFGVYEPTVTLMGFIGALLDPTKARVLALNIASSQ